MQQVTINLYHYSELSEQAKEKAKNWYFGSGFEYHWIDESIDSVKAFCQHFNTDLKEWSLCTHSYSYIKTDADHSCFRRFTLKEAMALPEYPTGYCLDHLLRQSFIDHFEQTGSAWLAFQNAIGEAKYAIIEDMKHQESEEYISEHLDSNEYTFTESGQRF